MVATARKPASLEFENTTSDALLALRLDVTSNDDIDAALEATMAKFDRIDVVVDNAGYGVAGPLETISEQQIRAQYDVNVFGVIEVTRRATKIMRERSPPGGLIQQITSMGSQISSQVVAVHCSSKWAIEGLTEGIAQEVKPEWNIKFTCIEPGMFGMDGFRNIVIGKIGNASYDHLDAVKMIKGNEGKQPGDVVKGARPMYKLSCVADPPLRCVLGDMAHERVQKKIEDYRILYSRPDVVDIVTNIDVD